MVRLSSVVPLDPVIPLILMIPLDTVVPLDTEVLLNLVGSMIEAGGVSPSRVFFVFYAFFQGQFSGDKTTTFETEVTKL